MEIDVPETRKFDNFIDKIAQVNINPQNVEQHIYLPYELSKTPTKDRKTIVKETYPSFNKWFLSIVLALITVPLVLAAGYWQFIYKSSNESANDKTQYAGRIIDANTRQAVQGAKINLDVQGVPQIYQTNTYGIFYLELPNTIKTTTIKVEAKGYEVLQRNLSLSNTEIEDISLILSNKIPLQIPRPVNSLKSKPPTAHPVQKPQQPKPSQGEDPALRILRGER